MNNTEGKAPSPYIIPAAIVVAGLLIAGAVFYSGGFSNGTGNLPSGGAPTNGDSLALEAAVEVGVDEGDFTTCYEEGRYADDVASDVAEFNATGLAMGTPTSFIVKDGVPGAAVVVGARDAATVGILIDQVMDGSIVQAAYDEQQGIGYIADLEIQLADGDHIRGDANAEVIVIEYSDLECPFCQRFHPEMQSVLENYDGSVAWVYRHLPLEAIHPMAIPLAEGSECAAELGGNDAFWEYIDYIFGV